MSDNDKAESNEETETQVHKLTKTILADGKRQVHEEEETTKKTTIEKNSDKIIEADEEEKEKEDEDEEEKIVEKTEHEKHSDNF